MFFGGAMLLLSIEIGILFQNILFFIWIEICSVINHTADKLCMYGEVCFRPILRFCAVIGKVIIISIMTTHFLITHNFYRVQAGEYYYIL